MATNEETNAAGTDTRPPMLVENDYESWKIRIHRYIRGKPNGKLIWKSIQNGPTPHPMVTDPPPTDSTIMPAPRKKLDSEFNEEENKLEMADTQAEIILSQGLPRHIFNILNQTSTAKEIWDNVELLMQGSGRTLQQRKEDLFDEYERFRAIGNESIHDYFVRFHKLVNDMKITQLEIPTHQMNTKFVNNLPAYWGKYVTNVKQNMDISTTPYVQIYTHLKAYEPHAKKTLKKQEQSTSIVDPLAYVAHTTSAPALSSPSTPSPQPTAQSPNDALMATMTQIANLLSGFQKQFPPTNNQLRTSSNSRTHATVHDGHIVTEPCSEEMAQGYDTAPYDQTSGTDYNKHVQANHEEDAIMTLTWIMAQCCCRFLWPTYQSIVQQSIQVNEKELSQEQVYGLSANEIASNASNPATPVTPFVHNRPPPSQVLFHLQKVNAVFISIECIDTSSASNAIFEINKLRKQLQGKDDTIRNLDAQINIMKVLNVGSTEDGLKVENVSLKRKYDELSKANTHSRIAYTDKLSALTAGNNQLKAQVTGKTSSEPSTSETPKVLAPGMYNLGANARRVEAHHRTLNKKNRVDSNLLVKHSVSVSNLNNVCGACNKSLVFANHNDCLVMCDDSVNVKPHQTKRLKRQPKKEWKPIKNVGTIKRVWKQLARTLIMEPTDMPIELPPSASSSPQITMVSRFTDHKLSDRKAGSKGISGCSRHMTGDRARLINFVEKFIGTVRFGNDEYAAIVGYGDYKLGDTIISRVYYVEGLKHNLFSVGQFCDGGLEVAFRQHSCYIRNSDIEQIMERSFKFVNKTIDRLVECVGMSHETSVPQVSDNRRRCLGNDGNRTLMEAARTMLIFAKAPLFLWAEAVATACYTLNRSLVHTLQREDLL
ncbi:retrovirus-related pol polyprotein from transposon TNT 1-94 [Tanacetum coccineum]|uniref:Retrovirus-related pol polyprotein from transposon TNT 1-94 n=1 Tax=Tanacetum coccineum TaxID=301880 RepID=A0ABQ5FZ72_9ASTR